MLYYGKQVRRGKSSLRGRLWKVLVKNNANCFLFQTADLLGVFIYNGRSYYTAPALKKRSRQTNEPPLWGSC